MPKTKTQPSRWITNLRSFMEKQGLNARSLSLKAGLNPTAVRDMLEGRTQFPRYDTVQALAEVLGTTPHTLMGSNQDVDSANKNTAALDDDLDLLTEIIARLQEVADEHKHRLGPRDFAAMVTTIYRQMQNAGSKKSSLSSLKPKIYDLMEYETRRKRATR